jgi:hypothetical protein
MKLNIVFCGVLLVLPSCDPFYLKPLDVHTVKKGDLIARWFYTSSITTIHNHVEIKTRKGWEQVMETDGNGDKIYDVLIDNDTVIVQAREGMVLYQLESYYWGTHVRFDTSISDFQYRNKFPGPNPKLLD